MLVDPRDLGPERARDALAAARGRLPRPRPRARAWRARSPRPRRPPRRRPAPGRAPARAGAARPAARRAAPRGRRRRRHVGDVERAAAQQRRAVGDRGGDELLDARAGLRASAAGRSRCRGGAGRRGAAARRRPRARRAAARPPRDDDEAADRGAVAAAAGERGPQRAGGRAVERRAVEHEHRALVSRRARVDDVVAAGAQVLVRRGERDQLERHAAALERRAHALAERRREHHRVAASSAAPVSSTGSAHGDEVPPRTPTDAARRRQQQRAAPGAQRRDAAEPLVAQRARAVVGEVVQAADRRQQLGEHRLGARLADDVGERVGQGSSSSRIAVAARRRYRAAPKPARGTREVAATGHPSAGDGVPAASGAAAALPPGGRQRRRPLRPLALAELEAGHAADRAGRGYPDLSTAPARRRPQINLRRLTVPPRALPTFLRKLHRPLQRSSARPPASSSRT